MSKAGTAFYEDFAPQTQVAKLIIADYICL